MKRIGTLGLALVAGVLFFNSCKDEEEEGTAVIAIRMTDTTANYDSVMIDVQAVEVTGLGSAAITLNTNAGMYNLLDFTNGKDTLIATATVPAGRVEQIRLILGPNNYVVIGGIRYNLSTPSAQQSGLKLNVHTDLAPGIYYTLLLDFDAGRSIVTTGNGSYSLKPVIRVVTVATDGSIAGSVAPPAAIPTLATAYNNIDTLSSFTDITGHFLIAGVPAGTYTLVLEPQLPYVPDTLFNISVSAGSLTDVGLITF